MLLVERRVEGPVDLLLFVVADLGGNNLGEGSLRHT